MSASSLLDIFISTHFNSCHRGVNRLRWLRTSSELHGPCVRSQTGVQPQGWGCELVHCQGGDSEWLEWGARFESHNLLTKYLPPSWLPWAHFLTCRTAVTTTHTYLPNSHPFSKDHWRIKSVNTCRSSQNCVWLTLHSQCEPPSPSSSPSPPYTGQDTVPTAANTTKTTGLTVGE